jgi:hypothetical protein
MRHWGSAAAAAALLALAVGMTTAPVQAAPATATTGVGALKLAAATNLVVAIRHDARAEGAAAVLARESGSAARQWISSNGTTTFVNKATGKCLSAGSPLDGLAVTQHTCGRGRWHQNWERREVGPGRFTLVNTATGKCLTAEGTAAGDRLYQDDCDQRQSTNAFAADQFTMPAKHPVRPYPAAADRG